MVSNNVGVESVGEHRSALTGLDLFTSMRSGPFVTVDWFLWGCRYLHEVCSPPVVHRNFKSANILLDIDLNPHVSDCGLAALASSTAESQVHI